MTARRFDAVVVGGGLAGMLTALELRPLSVALVSYRLLGELTSSAWAQGGIAAAVGDDDSPSLHAADTVRAGAGLVERRVAARLAADAPQAIERMASLGVQFDRDAASEYSLGREAAHSRRRILRAGGDATGAELVRAMAEAVRLAPAIVPFEGARALDVIVNEGRVRGIVLRLADGSWKGSIPRSNSLRAMSSRDGSSPYGLRASACFSMPAPSARVCRNAFRPSSRRAWRTASIRDSSRFRSSPPRTITWAAWPSISRDGRAFRGSMRAVR